MRKFLAGLLSIALLFSCFSALAEIKNKDLSIDNNGTGNGDIPTYVNGVTAMGDTLYFATYDNAIYGWSLATGETVKYDCELWGTLLIAGGETLYSLDQHIGLLTAIAFEEGKATAADESIQLDWSLISPPGTEEYSYPQIYAAFCTGDSLYLQTSRTDMDDWYSRVLYSFDLATGKCELLYMGKDMFSLSTYKEGKLLIIRFDQESYYTSQQESSPVLPVLQVFDPQTKAFGETLLTIDSIECGGLVYNEPTDTIYYMVPGNVQYIKAGEAPAQLTYLPISYGGNNSTAMILNGTHYALYYNGSAVYLRSLDPDDKPSSTLTISGGDFMWSAWDGYDAFTKKYPDVAVVPTEFNNGTLATAEDIFKDMKTDSASDIYSLYNLSSLDALMQKGYCLDLSSSPIIADTVAHIYPHISAAFTKDGAICALPYSANVANTMAYSPSLLKQVGLTEKDLPTDLSELLDFIADWVDIYSQDNPSLDLINHHFFKLRERFLELIFAQQIAYCNTKGIPVTFDTPEVLALLKKVDSMASIFKEIDPTDEELEGGWGWSSDDPLVAVLDFSYNLFGSSFNDHEDYVPLQINYLDDVPLYTMLYTSVFVVNPYSKNQEKAIRFLEEIATNLSSSSKVVLCPEYNEALESPYYAQNLKWYEDSLSWVTQGLEKAADEAEKKQFEERLLEMEEQKRYIERDRYDISPEQIAHYRDIALSVTTVTGSYSLFASSDNLKTLYERYQQQQIGAEQYIKETEKVLQKIHRESKELYSKTHISNTSPAWLVIAGGVFCI